MIEDPNPASGSTASPSSALYSAATDSNTTCESGSRHGGAGVQDERKEAAPHWGGGAKCWPGNDWP